MAAASGARRCLAAFLWAILICCIACFSLITFFRSSDYYRNTEFSYVRGNATLAFPGDVPVLTQEIVKDGKATLKNVGKNAPLWSGETAFIVSLQWGSMMIAGVAVAGLQHLGRSNPVDATLTADVTMAGPAATAWHQIRCLGSFQLAPRSLWSWWCGGLSVVDGFLVLAWLGLHVMYLYYLIGRKFQSAAVSVYPSPSAAATLAQADIDARFLLKRLDGTGKSFGEVMRVSIMLMFIPVSRSAFLQWVTGSDFPSFVKYHRWMSWGTIWLMLTHSLLYLIEWGAAGDLDTELSWLDEASKRNVCGLLSALGGLCIALTAHSWVRTNYYKVFYRTHVLGFLVFTIFGLMHYKNLINWIAPGLVWYGLDRAFRYWQLASNITTVTTNDVSISGNILNICLAWKKTSIPIKPGQSVYLRCFDISWLASHPFTVAHVSDEDKVTHVTIHIRVGGPWTCALRQRFLTGQNARIQVEGPYPSKIDYVTATPVTIMIAGGSGVTPLLGLLRQYAGLASDDLVKRPTVYFTWASRHLSELKLLGSDLLQASSFLTRQEKHSAVGVYLSDPTGDAPVSGSWLRTSLHYTGFEQEQNQHQQQINVLADAKLAASDTPTKSNSDTSTDHSSGSPAATLSTHPATTPWLYAVCIVLTYFGAWAGLLLASHYDAYRQRTTAAGPDVLVVGILQWVCVAAGAIIPTFIFLLIAHLVARRMPPSTTVGCATASEVQASFLSTTINVLPGYILAQAHGAAIGNKRVVLSRGRPDVAAVLGTVRAAHPAVEEIVVLVAGPESMYKSTLQHCARHNAVPGPQLVCKQVAHHF